MRKEQHELSFDILYKQFIKTSGSKTKGKKKALKLLTEADTIENRTILEEGFIYHFEYDPIHRDTLASFDNTPVVLSLGQSKKHRDMDLGINLNFLPMKYKYFLLFNIYKYNRMNIKNILNGKKTKMKCNYDFLKKIVPRELSFAIRLYYRPNKKDVRQYGMDDWGWISMIQLNDFHDITLSQVYKAWKQNK